jgi:hypothetical protein
LGFAQLHELHAAFRRIAADTAASRALPAIRSLALGP